MTNGEQLACGYIPKPRGGTVTAAELQGLKAGSVEMLIARILPTRACTLLSAHPKAGKSTLAMTLCHSVALGTPLFGKYPTRRTNVLYWIPDDGNTERLGRAWRAVAGLDAPETMFFNTERHELPTGFGFLKAKIAEHKIGLVVVDTYTSIRSAAGFDFVRDQYNDMRQFGGLAEETGATIIVIHHSAKGSIGDVNESAVIKAPAGSYGMTAGPDLLWTVTKLEHSERLISLSGRDTDDFAVVFRRDEDKKLRFVIDGPPAQHWPRIREASFHLEDAVFSPKTLGEALGLTARQGRRIVQQWFFDDVVVKRAGEYAFAEDVRAALGRKQQAEGRPEAFWEHPHTPLHVRNVRVRHLCCYGLGGVIETEE